ncbi:aminotransferase class V-fold PLP-dependent enzyme [Nocardioides aequoreus]|uniref:aminotransferase class V-fold PLP-dependent enzyme n=1 Tax=Nocardioides aequoreus TaxID=397278 RepID=UPI0004C3463A|nr:aminotransferase class V-fold PLP-dependent enzyme [Nocardioides aequoreus]
MGETGGGQQPLLHLDAASAGRMAPEVVEAVVAHLRLEAAEGGYEAATRAAPEIARTRRLLADLLGVGEQEVAFTESATAGLRLLLDAWPLRPGATVVVAPAAWGPNLALLAQRGLEIGLLDVDGVGVVDLEALQRRLREDPPDLLLLDQVASHRGLVQPVADVVTLARPAGVPVWVDAAQAVGHVDCATGADAVVLTGRKWLAGPRGVGALAVRRDAAARLVVPWETLEGREAYVAGRLGLGAALARLHRRGVPETLARLAEVGAAVRDAVAGLDGWRVVQPQAPAGSITTLAATAGQDLDQVRARLLEQRVLTTVVLPWRAPRDPLLVPGLRISGHVGTDGSDLDRLVAALR